MHTYRFCTKPYSAREYRNWCAHECLFIYVSQSAAGFWSLLDVTAGGAGASCTSVGQCELMGLSSTPDFVMTQPAGTPSVPVPPRDESTKKNFSIGSPACSAPAAGHLYVPDILDHRFTLPSPSNCTSPASHDLSIGNGGRSGDLRMPPQPQRRGVGAQQLRRTWRSSERLAGGAPP